MMSLVGYACGWYNAVGVIKNSTCTSMAFI